MRRNQGAVEGNLVEYKRISRKTERTPEERARLRAKREKFQRERPSLDALIESGAYEAMSQGDYFELMQAFAELRKVRESKSLSLTEVAKRSGIDKAALSRLETGRNVNPTLGTLETSRGQSMSAVA